MFCSRCGQPLEESDLFCSKCGQKIEEFAQEKVQDKPQQEESLPKKLALPIRMRRRPMNQLRRHTRTIMRLTRQPFRPKRKTGG